MGIIREVSTIAKRELVYFFNTPVGFIVSGLFAVFANFIFTKDLFLRGNSSMRPFFDMLPWLMLVFVPALAMRSFAEEKRLHTMEILLSLPIKEVSLVLGKFLGAMVCFLIALVLTFAIPVALFFIGKPIFAEIAVSYLGAIFIGGFFVSVAIYFSSLTKNQMVAFILSVLFLFAMIILGGDFMATILPNQIREMIGIFNPFYHYQYFLRGVIDLRAVLYFISFTSFFLYLTFVKLSERE